MNTIQNTSAFAELGLSQQPQGDKTSGELGQQDFLMLMTTQLRNQDPFKPIENTEFLSQLAQFGTVSGIEELRTVFTDLASSLYSNQSLQAASMVGHEVLVPRTQVELTQGGQVTGEVEVPQAVTDLKIHILDQAGQLVRTISLGSTPSGMGAFSWDGLTKEGEAVPPGTYEIRAEAVSGGTNQALDVLLAAQVQSVTLPRSGAPLTLELAGLGDVDFSEIRQIR